MYTLNESEKEVIYALFERQQKVFDASQKVQAAIQGQAKMIAKVNELEGENLVFQINGDNVVLVNREEE